MIITNGFSTIFPRGLQIGVIRSFDVSKNGAFYDILVEPSVDFSSLGHVYVLKGNFVRLPERDEMDSSIQEQLIVELYSK